MGINRIAFLAGQAGRIVLIAGFSLSIVASARAFEVTDEQREACTPDAFRLCSSEIPDVSRVAACMAAKKASLSPPCRAVFETASLDRAAPLPHHHRLTELSRLMRTTISRTLSGTMRTTANRTFRATTGRAPEGGTIYRFMTKPRAGSFRCTKAQLRTVVRSPKAFAEASTVGSVGLKPAAEY